MISLSKILLTCLLLFPATIFAAIPAGMKADFAPTGGYVIMPVGDEFLVDLDASANLKEGDILTLVMPGEKVVHPVTKEILGSLDIPKGYLQVTRIKSGYSYAKLLFSDSPPEKGDQIKRFEQIPTTFKAQTPNESILNQLKEGLPQLEWLKPDSVKQPLLIFELQGNLLSVKNNKGSILRNYQLNGGEIIAPAKRAAAGRHFAVDADPAKNKGFLNKTVNKLVDSVGLGGSDKGLPVDLGIIRNQQASGVWMSPNLEGEPAGIVVADFDNDGQLETIVAMENQIQIFQVNQSQLQELTKFKLPVGTRVLSLDTINQDKSSSADIYISAIKDKQLVSRVISYDGSEYKTTIDNIPWLFRVIAIPEEGQVLIGQRSRDHSQPFLGKPFRIIKDGNKLVKGEDLTIPNRVNFFGFYQLPNDSGGGIISYLTRDDYLKVITEGGQELWESSGYFGGSETRLYETFENHGDFIEPVYVQKRIIPGPEGEVLVAQNDGIRTLSRLRLFKDSRVVALSWNGFAMQENWRTSGLDGYLADFAVADADNDGTKELVMAVLFKHKSVLQKARSAIVIYELN